jgi:hypothetical protein
MGTATESKDVESVMKDSPTGTRAAAPESRTGGSISKDSAAEPRGANAGFVGPRIGGVGRTVSRAIETVLAVAIVVQVSTAAVEGVVHEWLGIALAILIVVHMVRSRHGLSMKRPVFAVVDIAMIACLLGQLASCVFVSEYVFSWLPALKGTAIARQVHMTCGYWLFVLASVHVGMHLRILLGSLMRNRAAVWCGRILFACCIVVGLWAWVDTGIGEYLMMQSGFAFVDESEPWALGFCRYLAIAVMLAGAVHYIGRLASIFTAGPSTQRRRRDA